MVKSNVSFEYGTHLLKNQICNAPFPVFFLCVAQKQRARSDWYLVATIKQTVNAICILHE